MRFSRGKLREPARSQVLHYYTSQMAVTMRQDHAAERWNEAWTEELSKDPEALGSQEAGKQLSGPAKDELSEAEAVLTDFKRLSVPEDARNQYSAWFEALTAYQTGSSRTG